VCGAADPPRGGQPPVSLAADPLAPPPGRPPRRPRRLHRRRARRPGTSAPRGAGGALLPDGAAARRLDRLLVVPERIAQRMAPPPRAPQPGGSAVPSPLRPEPGVVSPLGRRRGPSLAGGRLAAGRQRGRGGTPPRPAHHPGPRSSGTTKEGGTRPHHR
jgi:hypothetical protein